ncbi:MAG: hypothetical protein ACLU9S_24350 [Oscillospiraceae bacterium]
MMYGSACREVLTPEEAGGAAGAGSSFRGRYPEVSLTREELLRLAPDMVGRTEALQRHTKPGRRRKRTGRLPS